LACFGKSRGRGGGKAGKEREKAVSSTKIKQEKTSQKRTHGTLRESSAPACLGKKRKKNKGREVGRALKKRVDKKGGKGKASLICKQTFFDPDPSVRRKERKREVICGSLISKSQAQRESGRR